MPLSLLTFKEVVYDLQGQQILAPVMKKGNLLDCNVISFSNIESKREPSSSNAPVVYFIEPTLQNFRLVSQDCKFKVYDLMIVCFTKPLSSLEEFVNEVHQSG